MGDLISFPRRVEIVDPGPSDRLNAGVAGQPPPHDLDAEAAVLGGVFDLPDHLARLAEYTDRRSVEMTAICQRKIDAVHRAVEMLKPEHFFSLANQRIFEAMQHLLLVVRQPVDRVTVGAWIDEHGLTAKVGGDAYIEQLAHRTPASGDADAHAGIVLEMWERRRSIKTMQRMCAEMYGDLPDWNAYKAQARVELGRITAPREKLAGAPIGVAAAEARASIAAAQDGEEPGVPWGFLPLDEFGLLGFGKQHVIAGRPAMGKTAFSFQNAVRIAQRPARRGLHQAVYFCEWEMPRADFLEREACSLAGVSYKRLQRKRCTDEEVERVGRWLGALSSLPIWIDDQKCTPAELAQRVSAVKALFARGAMRRGPGPDGTPGELYPKCVLGTVWIDQLSHVKPPETVTPRWQKRDVVGETARQLQEQIAQRLKVATVLLCQLARPQVGAKTVEPTLHELRESGQIEEGADEVYAIHRPEYYERGKVTDEWRGVAQIIPLKGRYGGGDDAKLGFHGGRFEDDLPPAARSYER